MVRRASTPKLSEQTLYHQYDSSRYWYAPPRQSRTKEQAALGNREQCRNRDARKLLCFRKTARISTSMQRPASYSDTSASTGS